MSDSQVQSPSPTILRIRGLNTAHAIRAEMAAVYRDCRRKKLDTKDGAKLVFMLLSMFRVIEGSILEERLDTIEQRLEQADEHEKQAHIPH